jgi:cytochrome c553
MLLMRNRQSAIRPHGLLAVAVAALPLFSVRAWADGDRAQGRAKSAMCEGCHGIVGYRTAYPDVYPVPKLGGQASDYLAKALRDYKSGARAHPTMRGIASGLSDQDIADLAAYYSDPGKRAP